MNENNCLPMDYDEFDMEFNYEEMEVFLSQQLEESFSELELLDEDRKKIGNPDSLGKTILEEVWTQFGNQIGLDVTNETLIQRYDREHPETYKDVEKTISTDNRYTDKRKEVKSQQMAGDLKDSYTGKRLAPGEKANVDHVVSKKELYDNKRRRQANIATEDLANKDENLQATNENLNKSMKDDSKDKYIANREKREADLRKQNERANKKIDDNPNLSDLEKRLAKEKNDKALQNKLDADDELLKKADKQARKAINKEITKGVVKEVGKKAGKDALKATAISALSSLLKEVMNGLVRFFKSKAKSFRTFLDEMKASIKSFFEKIASVLKTGVSALVGTIVSEIFGPIVSTFRKLASFIKQGVSSFIDAISYLKDKSNKSKPFAIKVAEVGKIVTGGLTVAGGIVLGDVFEKILMGIPVMLTPLPLIGTLANIVGLFLGSLVSGLIGAIVLNMIDKYIASRLKSESTKEIIGKKNDVLNLQNIQKVVAEHKLDHAFEMSTQEINQRHQEFENGIKRAVDRLSRYEEPEVVADEVIITANKESLDKMKAELEGLL